MRIVAFGHRKRVGKDTAAKFLISHTRMTYPGLNVRKAGFSDKVKSIACELFCKHGLQAGDFYEEPQNAHLRYERLPGIEKTPVELWIGVGNGLRAATVNSVWYDYLLGNVRADLLVVKDMRFPGEADGILSQGGLVYRIDRPGVRQDNDGADDQLVGYDRWSGVITNDGDLNDLHAKIVAIAGDVLGVRQLRV